MHALARSRICQCPSPQPFTPIGVKETGVAIQRVLNQVSDRNRSYPSNLSTAGHKSLIYFTGNEVRKDLRKWIAPPDPSLNYNAAWAAHHEGTAAWCTEGSPLADWRTSGSLLWIHGKRTHPITVPVLILTNDPWPGIDSWLWEKYSQVRYRPQSCVPIIELM